MQNGHSVYTEENFLYRPRGLLVAFMITKRCNDVIAYTLTLWAATPALHLTKTVSFLQSKSHVHSV